MHGIRRVLVFLTLTAILPITLLLIHLYLRHSFYADVAYAVTESDIMEVNDGISTIFCSEHILRMNGTFNAFQMAQRPEVTSYRKHIRLKKSINLPDDTLEYWGFYLLKSATVLLSVCSRFEGASLLVVKGERSLRTCGLLEHNNEKEDVQDIFLPGANRQVKIIYESNAQEIDSKELIEPTDVYNVSEPSVDVTVEHSSKKNFTSTDNSAQKYNATIDVQNLETLYRTAASYVRKHSEAARANDNIRKLRHATNRRRKMEKNMNERAERRRRRAINPTKETRVQRLKRELYSHADPEADVPATKAQDVLRDKRFRRSRKLIKPPSLLDRGIRHGGNADRNSSESNDMSSVSSFERDIFNCYGGKILLAHEFEPSDQCTDINYLISGKHMQASHHVEEDGYYYYIFYSDNDIVSNDIYALFDIYKPTFQYENVTNSCINRTECSFTLSPLSPDRVIVEVATRDGIEHDEMDDISILISTCHPRMGAYIIFPIAILFMILGCAFI